MWVWQSIRPGSTVAFPRSMTLVPVGSAAGPHRGDAGAVDQDDRIQHRRAAPAVDQPGGADGEAVGGGVSGLPCPASRQRQADEPPGQDT